MVSGFGAKIVKHITGVSRMQLQHWDKSGIVQPSIKSGTGKGSRREYSFKDLVQLKMAKRLRDEGISLQKIKKATEFLRKNFPDLKAPLAELRFVTDGTEIFVLTHDSKVILDALKEQLVFSFALGDLIETLKGLLKSLEMSREYTVIVQGMEFTVMLIPDMDDGGYTVRSKEIPAAITQGETVQEALGNICDAIELCLSTESEPSSGHACRR